MENINDEHLFLVCQKWACKDETKLVDNLNALISDFTADIISKTFRNSTSQLTLAKIILLRRNLSTSFEASILESCKLLINHITAHLDSTSHKNEQLTKIVSLCFDILLVANEDDFCIRFIQSHVDKISNADHGFEEKSIEMALHAIHVMLCSLRYVRNAHPLTQGLKTLELFQNKSFHKLISDFVFNCKSTRLECYTLFTIIPKLVEATNICSVVDILWNEISSRDSSINAPLSLKLLILCGLSELLPFNQAPKVNSEQLVIETVEFWEIIQEALISDDALHRKRGLYLLKRTLDYLDVFKIQLNLEIMIWDHFQSDLMKQHWEKMFIVLEVLEEKQSHLVTPVVQTILRGIDDDKFIHSSWFLIVFTRFISHDSLQIVKLGILSFLKIKVNCYVRLTRYKQVIYLLCEKLNNMLLFTDSSCDAAKTGWTEMDLALTHWFKSIPLSLDPACHKEFYTIIFEAIMRVQWCTLPLFHVLYSISLVNSVEIIDEPMLPSLTDFLIGVIRTQNVFFRGAVQCIILNLLISLSSSNISSLNAAYTLNAFKQNECLFRGLETWEQSKKWLQSCSRYESDTLVNLLLSDNGVSIASRARSLVLLVDSGLIVLNSSFSVSLKNYFSVLEDCGIRLYASVEKSDKCLEMIVKILEESKRISSEVNLKNDLLIKSLTPYIKEAVPYIEKRVLKTDHDLTNFDSVELYSKALTVLNDSELTSLGEARDLVQKVTTVIFSSEFHLVKRYLCLKIVQWYMETVIKMTSKSSNLPVDCENMRLFCSSMIGDYNLAMDISRDTKDEDLSRHHQRHWGQLSSSYIETFWSIVKRGLDAKLIVVSDILDTIHADTMMEKAISSVESGGQASLVSILAAVKYVLPFVEDLDTVLRFLQFSWTSCFELRKVATFWPSIKAWIEMAFSKDIIIQGGLQKTLLNFAREMLMEGENVCGLSNVMLTHFREELRDVITIKPLLEVLTSAILFGPILRRDQRIENETYALIRSLGSSFAVNVLMPNGSIRTTSSGEVRVTALAIVLRGGEEVWKEVVCRLLEHDNLLTAQRRRYHGDSLHHRLRHRILQALLVLEFVLTDIQTIQAKSCVADLAKWASTRLQADSHQPSVRYQLEWLLVRALLHSPVLLPSFWTIFNQASDERTGSICSFISVAYHLAAALKNVEFIDRCVKEILPWCMAQHFNVRLYAQVVLQKLWPLNEVVASKYDVIRHSLSHSLNQGNAVRNAEKLSTDFYFTTFHPINHYSLETVFYELPRLSNISKDEWIPLKTLKECFNDEDVLVPLANSEDSLSQFTTAAWILKATGEAVADADMETSGMQKKFVPWKSMFPEFEMGEKTTTCSQLIVVATLIDKMPNLGGLARTCEIFTAQCLVVPSLEHTRDKLFETLSMSAEKHVKIVEVKPHDLPHYLNEKKELGYTLVGAEQTAASVSLNTFKFPRKCLLLLGNEKEGIPVNLLPLLDTCVEVPQLGVVRSLNVHVTGALFVWEYTKQFLYTS